VTVRVAVVGCGTVARRSHLPGLRSAGADLVAFASRSRRSAQEAARLWGGGEVLDSWHEVLERSDVDAIDVCTPNASHAEITVAAARAGKHVLVEKPMACTVDDADRMVEAARSAGTVLMPAHNARFGRPFVAMRNAVARGDIGEVRAFRCAWGHAGPEGWAPDADWFRDRALAGGGALIDLGVHAADVLRAVLGDEPAAVCALLWPDRGDSGSGRRDQVEDLAQLVVRFSQGALGTLQASWAVSAGSDHQLTIQGTGGTLHLDDHTPPTLLPSGGGEPLRLPLPEESRGVFDAFVDAVEHGSQPAVTADDGRAAVALVAAAYRSAESGHVESVDGAGNARER
jgi:UDP-N-acetylglucosamine 3-dehydrogenase